MTDWTDASSADYLWAWAADVGPYTGPWPLLPPGDVKDIVDGELDFFLGVPAPDGDLLHFASNSITGYGTDIFNATRYVFPAAPSTTYYYNDHRGDGTGPDITGPPTGAHLFVLVDNYDDESIPPSFPPESIVPPSYAAAGTATLQTALGHWSDWQHAGTVDTTPYGAISLIPHAFGRSVGFENSLFGSWQPTDPPGTQMGPLDTSRGNMGLDTDLAAHQPLTPVVGGGLWNWNNINKGWYHGLGVGDPWSASSHYNYAAGQDVTPFGFICGLNSPVNWNDPLTEGVDFDTSPWPADGAREYQYSDTSSIPIWHLSSFRFQLTINPLVDGSWTKSYTGGGAETPLNLIWHRPAIMLQCYIIPVGTDQSLVIPPDTGLYDPETQGTRIGQKVIQETTTITSDDDPWTLVPTEGDEAALGGFNQPPNGYLGVLVVCPDWMRSPGASASPPSIDFDMPDVTTDLAWNNAWSWGADGENAAWIDATVRLQMPDIKLWLPGPIVPVTGIDDWLRLNQRGDRFSIDPAIRLAGAGQSGNVPASKQATIRVGDQNSFF